MRKSFYILLLFISSIINAQTSVNSVLKYNKNAYFMQQVGIGTTTPAASLQVDGNASLGQNNTVSGSQYSVALGSGNTASATSANRSAIAIGTSSSVTGDNALSLGGKGNTVTGSAAIAIGTAITNNIIESIMIGNSSNVTTFLNNGSVGIGTTTPTNKLKVNGTLQATNSDGMLIYNHPQELSLFGTTFYLPSTKCQYVDTTDNYHYTSGVEIIPESLTGQPDAPQSIFSAIDPNSNLGYFQRITKANGFEFARARGFSLSLAEQVIFDSAQFLITSHGLGTNIVLQPSSGDGNVGIGTTTPQSVLDVASTNSGILFPRIADNASVTTPVEGMVIYSLALHKLQVYTGASWETIISAP